MRHDRDELENQLHAKAKEAISNLLEALPDKAELTMSDMERLIGEMGHEIMRETMQGVAQREQVEPSQVMCEACQIQMYKRGKRKKRVVTQRGEIELERQYYVCPQCGTGSFPPG
jgi:Zn finger protein HypA/HybF involved in hydrogenase expression